MALEALVAFAVAMGIWASFPPRSTAGRKAFVAFACVYVLAVIALGIAVLLGRI